AIGRGGDDEGGGGVGQLRAGLEARVCTDPGVLCLVGGLDLGYQYARWQRRSDELDTDTGKGLVAVPRIGLDLGGDGIRFRLAFELSEALYYVRSLSEPSGDTSTTSLSRRVGVARDIRVAYQW